MKIEKGDDPNNLEIVITRDFNAPREMVFDACTTPSAINKWQVGTEGHTMPVCEIDLRVGGKWRFVWRMPDGSEMGAGGVYQEVNRPVRIVHSELFDEDWTGGESVVTSEFKDTPFGTTLVMTIKYASTEARDGALTSPMSEGMEAGYRKLDSFLSQTV